MAQQNNDQTDLVSAGASGTSQLNEHVDMKKNLWEDMTGIESMMCEMRVYELNKELEELKKGLKFYKKTIAILQRKVHKEHQTNLRYLCELNHLKERQRLASREYIKIDDERKMVQQYIRPD